MHILINKIESPIKRMRRKARFFLNNNEKKKGTWQIFQRRFNVVFTLMWRRGVAQRQINIQITLWIWPFVKNKN